MLLGSCSTYNAHLCCEHHLSRPLKQLCTLGAFTSQPVSQLGSGCLAIRRVNISQLQCSAAQCSTVQQQYHCQPKEHGGCFTEAAAGIHSMQARVQICTLAWHLKPSRQI